MGPSCHKVDEILKGSSSVHLSGVRGALSNEQLNHIMNMVQSRSCWGVARTALTVFLLGVAVVYLFGGFDPSAMNVK